MKKIFVSLSMLMILAAKTVAQDTESNCQLANVVVVDGKADEWTLPWLESDDKNFSYNVCSDDYNLYIRMKTSNDMIKRKIGLFGLTLWMDPNGKKKKKLGFKFPSGTEGAERMETFRKEAEGQNHERQSAGERAEFQKKMEADLIQNLEVIELIGLTDDPITATRSGITNGIKVAIAADPEAKAYVYEAVLPFKSYRLSKKSIEKLGIGFETGKYVAPKDKTSQGAQYVPQGGVGNNGGRGGYNGGFGGGRGYGGYGGGGGPRGGSHPMASASSCWFTVKMK
jgi:hypothetical protein